MGIARIGRNKKALQQPKMLVIELLAQPPVLAVLQQAIVAVNSAQHIAQQRQVEGGARISGRDHKPRCGAVTRASLGCNSWLNHANRCLKVLQVRGNNQQ